MSSVPYIGSQISLISKSDIRYEGTLHTIDPNEHTVSLSNVKSFGTEGRRGNGKEIPPSAEVYEFIIFRGSDIKDLTVIQTTVANNDPAIIKSEPTKEAQPKPVQKPIIPQQREHQNYAPRNNRQEAYGELHGNTNEDLKEELKEDFDFQTAAIDRNQKAETKGKCYDKKSSFFDNISCKSGENPENRPDREKQKELDSETFGEEYVEMGERDLKRYIRGGRRGRRGYRNDRGDGRGYRGGYRGEHREYRGEHREYRGEQREYRGEQREYRGENREYRGEHRGEYRGGRRGEYRGYRGDRKEDFRGESRGN